MDLELNRSPQDTRLYALEGVGKVRIEGRFATRATAKVADGRWTFARRAGRVVALDPAGEVAGRFSPHLLGGSGTLTWRDREFGLGGASGRRERYALVDGDRELAQLDAGTWGKRPVAISIVDLGDVEPALLLFTAWVVRLLARGPTAAAGGG